MDKNVYKAFTTNILHLVSDCKTLLKKEDYIESEINPLPKFQMEVPGQSMSVEIVFDSKSKSLMRVDLSNGKQFAKYGFNPTVSEIVVFCNQYTEKDIFSAIEKYNKNVIEIFKLNNIAMVAHNLK